MSAQSRSWNLLRFFCWFAWPQWLEARSLCIIWRTINTSRDKYCTRQHHKIHKVCGDFSLLCNIVMQIYVFGLDSPSLFSVIYAAAAVHLCVSCMLISFISEKLFKCTVTTLMTCAISFLLSLRCNLQICGKSSLISTVSLTRPPSLSTSKSLSFRNISSKSYKPLMSNRSVSFRLQNSSAFEI